MENNLTTSHITNYNTIKIKFLYFAKVKDILKNKSSEFLEIKTNESDFVEIRIKEIFDYVKKSNPDCSKDLDLVFINCLIALNDEYLSEDRESLIILKNNDEVAVLPPISAG